MQRHITRLSTPRMSKAQFPGPEEPSQKRLEQARADLNASSSVWQRFQKDYYIQGGVRLLTLDDTQLENFTDSDDQISCISLEKSRTVRGHWSGSSNGSISSYSSHGYLSTSSSGDSASSGRTTNRRYSQNAIDGLLLNYHVKADKLSADLAKLALHDSDGRYTNANGGTPRPDNTNGSLVALSQGLGPPKNGQKPSSHRRRVNRRHTDDDESSAAEGAHNRSLHRDIDPYVEYLACPFVKNDPDHFKECNFVMIKTISILKQHLRRAHKLGNEFCQRCLEHFNTRYDFEQHDNTICEKKTSDAHHSIYLQLNKRLRSDDPYQAWFRIYEIIFPISLKPSNPFPGDQTRHHIRHLIESLGKEETLNVVEQVRTRRHTISCDNRFHEGALGLMESIEESVYGNVGDEQYLTEEPIIEESSSSPSNLGTEGTAAISHTGFNFGFSTVSQDYPSTYRTSTTSNLHPLPGDPNIYGDLPSYNPTAEDYTTQPPVLPTAPSPPIAERHNVRGIEGKEAQDRINRIVDPALRHSNPNPRARPWVTPQPRPHTENFQDLQYPNSYPSMFAQDEPLQENDFLQQNVRENLLVGYDCIQPLSQNHGAARQRPRMTPNNRWLAHQYERPDERS